MILKNKERYKWTKAQIEQVQKKFPAFFNKIGEDDMGNDLYENVEVEYISSRIKIGDDGRQIKPPGMGLLARVKLTEGPEDNEYVWCESYQLKDGVLTTKPGVLSVTHRHIFNHNRDFDSFMFLALCSPQVENGLSPNKFGVKVRIIDRDKEAIEALKAAENEDVIRGIVAFNGGHTDAQIKMYAEALDIEWTSSARVRDSIRRMASSKSFQDKFLALIKDQNLLKVQTNVNHALNVGVIEWNPATKKYLADFDGDGMRELVQVPPSDFKDPKSYLVAWISSKREIAKKLNDLVGRDSKSKEDPLDTTIEDYKVSQSDEIKALLFGRSKEEHVKFFGTAKFNWQKDLKQELMSELDS